MPKFAPKNFSAPRDTETARKVGSTNGGAHRSTWLGMQSQPPAAAPASLVWISGLEVWHLPQTPKCPTQTKATLRQPTKGRYSPNVFLRIGIHGICPNLAFGLKREKKKNITYPKRLLEPAQKESCKIGNIQDPKKRVSPSSSRIRVPAAPQGAWVWISHGASNPHSSQTPIRCGSLRHRTHPKNRGCPFGFPCKKRHKSEGAGEENTLPKRKPEPIEHCFFLSFRAYTRS